MLNGILSVVSNFSPHIVDEERLGEIVFIVGEGHGLKVKGHHGTALNIAKLVATSCSVAVGIEEFGNGSFILREIGILTALIPLLIVVEDVIGGWGEELIKLLVLEDLIENPDLIDGGLSTLISDTGSSNQ